MSLVLQPKFPDFFRAPLKLQDGHFLLYSIYNLRCTYIFVYVLAPDLTQSDNFLV